jgi:hypothetical protein
MRVGTGLDPGRRLSDWRIRGRSKVFIAAVSGSVALDSWIGVPVFCECGMSLDHRGIDDAATECVGALLAATSFPR